MASGCAPFSLRSLQIGAAKGLRRRVNPWELLGAAFGLANIALLARRSVWNYPCGMAMVAILAVVFWHSRLYAVAGLQLFFFAAQAHGLITWLKAPIDANGDGGQVQVRRLPRKGWPVVLISGFAASVALAALLAQTDAVAPISDGTVAGWSLVAQLLTNLRMLESWPLWVGINILSIALYASQSLWITALLYVAFLIGAIWSWRLWWTAQLQGG